LAPGLSSPHATRRKGAETSSRPGTAADCCSRF
jgi:hypothetical protein